MPEQQKVTYPAIPAKHWWTIRERFQQTIPTVVTPGYLATALGMTEPSAKANIIPSLVQMKIIEQDGKPTERARRWRDNVEYADVCREIREEVYPRELLEATQADSVDRAAIERWFSSKTGVGTRAAQKFAAVYGLLVTAAIPEKREGGPARTRQQPAKNDKTRKNTPSEPPEQTRETKPAFPGIEPSVHIDIQIHISPDANPDQIDQIFASMARHLKGLRTGDV